MIKNIFICIICFMMIGCVSNGMPNLNLSDVHPDVKDSVYKEFVGIPPLLSEEGSSVRLNDQWIITAKHIRHIIDFTKLDVWYHPTCDVALIREDGESKTKLGIVYEGDKVTHVGYPMGLPMAANNGEVFVDFHEDCWYSTSTAPIIGGMSGGGVFNEENLLVGINIGVANVTYNGDEYKNITMFLSLLSVQDWIYRVTKERLVFENANN